MQNKRIISSSVLFFFFLICRYVRYGEIRCDGRRDRRTETRSKFRKGRCGRRPPVSICSYQSCSPTCDKFCPRSKFRGGTSALPLHYLRSPVHPCAGGQVRPAVLLFFPLNSLDTWPSSLPRGKWLKRRGAIGGHLTRVFASSTLPVPFRTNRVSSSRWRAV